MPRNVKFLFRILLWMPVILVCVLLMSVFPQHRKEKRSAVPDSETNRNPLSQFQTALGDDILEARKT